jgi:hypothetical protein
MSMGGRVNARSAEAAVICEHGGQSMLQGVQGSGM